MSIKKSIKKSSVVICCVIRNCEKTLENEIRIINKSFKQFKKVSWIIVESDSRDFSIQKIKSLQNKFDINLISLGNLRYNLKKRTERIAKCRNKYLNILKKKKYNNFDFVAVADLDGVNNLLNEKKINACWNSKKNWDACFANQDAPYYDIWALRHKYWSPNDCFKTLKFLNSLKINTNQAKRMSYLDRMLKINKKLDPIEVDSAFGGFAIYKKKIIKNCHYRGLDKNNNELCEHVHFNNMIKRKKAKLFIMPHLINSSYNEHNSKVIKKNINDNIIVLFYKKIISKIFNILF